MRRHARLLTRGRCVLAALLVVGSSVLPFAKVSAADGPGNGLRVSPVVSNITINPGQNKTIDVYLTNVTGVAATFQVVVNDFAASGDESGTPALILDDNKSAPTHSLREFVPTLANVTLAPGEQKDIKVPISVPANAVAGGYYGAVRFAATSGAQSGRNVAVAASVASLILVKVPGSYKEAVNIQSLDVRRKDHVHPLFTKGSGLDAVVRFKNTGDIQEQPFGKITVTKTGGKVVYTTEINNTEPPSNVLPDSVRKFTIPLKSISSFGKYTVVGDFGYGKGQTLTAKTSFYVLPLPLIIVLLVLVVLLIIAIVELPRILKRYNRRLLRRAGRR